MNVDCFWQPLRQVSIRLGREALGLRSRQDGAGLVHDKLGTFQVSSALYARTIISKAVPACVVSHGDALWDQRMPGFEFGPNFQKSSFLGSKIQYGNFVALVGAAVSLAWYHGFFRLKGVLTKQCPTSYGVSGSVLQVRGIGQRWKHRSWHLKHRPCL